MYGSDGFYDDDCLQRKIETVRGRKLVSIPCPSDDTWEEVSNSNELCRHPVVSVLMITYNHEKFLRQAIEGVVCQKTDFEFELLIGEDCSTDNTRTICLEYQKRFPKIVRVIFGEMNTREKYGTYKVNIERLRKSMRGQFVALCEGDDYWSDPLKLQKQVEVFKKHPNVSMCYTRTAILIDATGEIAVPHLGIKPGLINGPDFWRALIDRRGSRINTCAIMYRRDVLTTLYSSLRFPSWDLTLGDVPLMICLASVGDVYLVDSASCVYRVNGGSVSQNSDGRVGVDNYCISAYLSYLLFHLPIRKFPSLEQSFRVRFNRIVRKLDHQTKWDGFWDLFSSSVYASVMWKPWVWLYYPIAQLGAWMGSSRLTNLVQQGVWSVLKTQIHRRIIQGGH